MEEHPSMNPYGGHMAREIPSSTAEKLYIDADWQSFGLDEIVDRINDHFPEAQSMTYEEIVANYQIEIERIQVTGCGCCYDPSDWNTYIVITRKV